MHNNIQIIMAFDFGIKKIGVAVGDSLTQTANPILISKNINNQPNWQEIKYLVTKYSPDKFIIGMPINPTTNKLQKNLAAKIQDFANNLFENFKIPYEFIDEQFTSIQANQYKKNLRQLGAKKSSLKNIDHIAAQIILELWFNQQN